MIKVNKLRMLAVLLILAGTRAQAEMTFPDILRSLTAGKSNIVTEVPELDRLLHAKDLESARLILQNKSLTDYSSNEKTSVINTSKIADLIRKRNLTFVIVPGVLGEFIDTRAFEEVFARSSSFRTQWETAANQARAMDSRFDLESFSVKPQKISELVNAGSIDDSQGKPLVKLVILRTYLGSMDSVGSNVEKAAVFNRRLQIYMNLMKDQNVILMGYSRGTPLALEMITQAQAQGLSYLKNVKAVVSYAGVVSGSALADVTDDLNTDSGKQLAAAKILLSKLQTSNSIWDRPQKLSENTLAINQFLFAVAGNSKFDPNAFLASARSGDSKTVMALITKMLGELGFMSVYDFNGHVNRVKFFIGQVLNAVEELKSRSLVSWWKTHNLPRNIQYLSIAAAMVDPDKSQMEKNIFDLREGYSDSLDDQSLIENQRTYAKLTGVSMNDSQVALYQSLFLPEIIRGLNPQNANLNIKSLGILQTHHWGVSLQVVNKMKDGRLNPFPRESVLLALAAYLNQ